MCLRAGACARAVRAKRLTRCALLRQPAVWFNFCLKSTGAQVVQSGGMDNAVIICQIASAPLSPGIISIAVILLRTTRSISVAATTLREGGLGLDGGVELVVDWTLREGILVGFGGGVIVYCCLVSAQGWTWIEWRCHICLLIG